MAERTAGREEHTRWRLQRERWQRVITIRLEPDSDVLKGIEEACRKYDLKNGVIISGLGSLRRAEYFNPLSFPDGRVAYGDPIIREEILELVSISGIVCHDEDGTISPHVHVTLSRNDGSTVGGHLGYGSLVLATTDLVLGRIEQVDMCRRMDPKMKVPVFHPTQL